MDTARDRLQVLISELVGNLPRVYDELRAIARQYMSRERPEHSLSATGLVHEAFLRLARQKDITSEDRTPFIAMAANVMRQVLVDRARVHGAQKRGGQWKRITLHANTASVTYAHDDLLVLEEALGRLAADHPRHARIIELAVFGGLSNKEIAEVLELSEATVSRDFRVARAMLRRDISRETRGP